MDTPSFQSATEQIHSTKAGACEALQRGLRGPAGEAISDFRRLFTVGVAATLLPVILLGHVVLPNRHKHDHGHHADPDDL